MGKLLRAVIYFFGLLVTFISCNEKKQIEKGPEDFTLQGVWLYSEFDYLPPHERVPVDADGFVEKHFFWLYNPTDDTILVISDFDNDNYGNSVELILQDDSGEPEKKMQLYWYTQRKGKVIYPKEGVLGYGVYEVPNKFRLNDSLISVYFEFRRMELMNTIMLLRHSYTPDRKYKNIISFNKCNVYDSYLRNVKSINEGMKILPDSTITTGSTDTLMEFYWKQFQK